MLPAIYGLTSILVIISILRRRNPLTLTSFYGIGTIIYGCPLYLGFTLFAESFQPSLKVYCASLDSRIYAMFLAAQGVYFLAVLCKRKAKPAMRYIPSGLTLNAVTIVLAMSILGVALSVGPDVYLHAKAERMDRLGFTYFAGSILASAIIILYVLARGAVDRRYLYLPALFVLLDLSLGFRQMFLVAGIATIAYAEARDIRFTMKSKARLTAAVLAVMAAALLYKPLYGMMISRVFDSQNLRRYVLMSVLGNEPYAVAGSLNEVLINDARVPEGYVAQTVLQYVPFYIEITRTDWTGFNSACQSMFPDIKWGIASTAFGELYAIGSWAAIAVFLLLQLLFLWSRPPGNPYLLALYYHLSAYVLFYFYRNDWHYIIGVIRQYVFVAAIVWMVYSVLWLIKHARRVRQQSGCPQET